MSEATKAQLRENIDKGWLAASKMEDLLRQCAQILGPRGSNKWVWCNERTGQWEVVDGRKDPHSPGLYPYRGPSLTEALEVLVKEE